MLWGFGSIHIRRGWVLSLGTLASRCLMGPKLNFGKIFGVATGQPGALKEAFLVLYGIARV